MPKLTIDGKTVEFAKARRCSTRRARRGFSSPRSATIRRWPPTARAGSAWSRSSRATGRASSPPAATTSATGWSSRPRATKSVKARRGVMELLLARAPESEPLKEMAQLLGVQGRAAADGDAVAARLHPLRALRERLPRDHRRLRDLLRQPRREPRRRGAVPAAFRGVHRLRRLRRRLPRRHHQAALARGRGRNLAVQEPRQAPQMRRVRRGRSAACRWLDRVRKKIGEPLAAAALLCDSCKRKRAAATNARLARTSR